MIRRKNALIRLIIALFFIFLAYPLRAISYPSEHTLIASLAMILRYVIQISLLIVWCSTLYNRLMDRKVKWLMIGVGALLIVWLTARTVKYEFLPDNSCAAARYVWYCYYISIITIPLLCLYIQVHIGKPEHYAMPSWMLLLLIPAGLLIAAVFTNDLHQLVFRFYNGIENHWYDYEYGFLYYVIMGWAVHMGMFFVVMLLKKSRVPGTRKMQKLPLFLMVGTAGFWVVHSVFHPSVDLVAIVSIIIVSLLESCIQCGLIPTNSHYQELLQITTVPLQIIDRDYISHYVSGSAQPISKPQLSQACCAEVYIDDTVLRSAPISAGYVVWQDDISKINQLNSKLIDIRLHLSEENTLLQAELEMLESRIKAEEKNRLYDRIAIEVSRQLTRADELLDRIEAEPDHSRLYLSRLCVLGSYIKRRGNLLLLAEENPMVQAAELEHCLRESLDNIRVCQVFTLLDSNCQGQLSVADAVAAYDFFESVAEMFFDQFTAMLVNLNCLNGQICMNIQIGFCGSIAKDRFRDLSAARGEISVDIMDEDAVIQLLLKEGGGSV